MATEKFETIVFGEAMKTGVLCPTCRETAKGMTVSEKKLVFSTVTEKRLLPCQHVITKEQEEAIVMDVLKRGM